MAVIDSQLAALAELKRKTKPHKFRAKSVEIDCHTFPSRLEAAGYVKLRAMQSQGMIRGLMLQPRYELDPKTEVRRALVYVADFQYADLSTGKVVVQDFKGCETAVFQRKARLFRKKYPGIELRVTRMSNHVVSLWLARAGIKQEKP